MLLLTHQQANVARAVGAIRRNVCCLLLFSLVVWGCQTTPSATAPQPGSVPVQTVSNGLVFFSFADWGVYGQFHQRQVADQMERYAAALPPSFMTVAGDNFYTTGVKSLTDAHWQLSFEQVYTGPHLPNAFYVALGNHDYQQSPLPELQYGQQHPRWVMPDRYYTKVISLKNQPLIRLVVLDTSPFVQTYRQNVAAYPDILQDTDRQLRWADSVLARATEPWKIVVGHHPLYSVGADHGGQPELLRQLGPLLQKYGVQLYLCGHSHTLQRLPRVGPTDFVVSGAGGALLGSLATDSTRAVYARAVGGFAVVSVNADSLRMSFVDNLGQPLYNWKRSRN